jgi:hypothetical protein
MIGKERIVVEFNALSRNLPGGTEENNKKLQSG